MRNIEKFKDEVNELFEQEGWLPCDIVNGGLLMGDKGTCKGCKYEKYDGTCLKEMLESERNNLQQSKRN